MHNNMTPPPARTLPRYTFEGVINLCRVTARVRGVHPQYITGTSPKTFSSADKDALCHDMFHAYAKDNVVCGKSFHLYKACAPGQKTACSPSAIGP